MAHDIDALLRLEELNVRPTSGTLDVAAIGRQLLALPGAWNDPNRPQVYLLFSDAAARDGFLATHEPSTPERYSYPIVPVVEVRPDDVYLNLFAGEEFNGQTGPFIAWLLQQQPCTVKGG